MQCSNAVACTRSSPDRNFEFESTHRWDSLWEDTWPFDQVPPLVLPRLRQPNYVMVITKDISRLLRPRPPKQRESLFRLRISSMSHYPAHERVTFMLFFDSPLRETLLQRSDFWKQFLRLVILPPCDKKLERGYHVSFHLFSPEFLEYMEFFCLLSILNPCNFWSINNLTWFGLNKSKGTLSIDKYICAISFWNNLSN